MNLEPKLQDLLVALITAYPDHSVSYAGQKSGDDVLPPHCFKFLDAEGLPDGILTVSIDALIETHSAEIVEYMKFPKTAQYWKEKGVNNALVLDYDAMGGLKHS